MFHVKHRGTTSRRSVTLRDVGILTLILLSVLLYRHTNLSDFAQGPDRIRTPAPQMREALVTASVPVSCLQYRVLTWRRRDAAGMVRRVAAEPAIPHMV